MARNGGGQYGWLPGQVPEPDDTAVRKWAKGLKPDYIGKVAGGLYGCLLTWVGEQGDFMWAFAADATRDSAHERAVGFMVEQRLKGVIWTPPPR